MSVVDQGAWQTLHHRPASCAIWSLPFRRRDWHRTQAWYLGRMMDLFDQRWASIRGLESGGEALGYMSLDDLYEKPEQNIYDHQGTGRPAFPLCRSCLKAIVCHVGYRRHRADIAGDPAGGQASTAFGPESVSLVGLYESLYRGFEAGLTGSRPPGSSCWVEEGWSEAKVPEDTPLSLHSERLINISLSFMLVDSLPSYILSKLERVPADVAGPLPSSPPSPPPSGSPVRTRLIELPLPPEITQQVARFIDRRSRFALRLVCAGFAVSLPLDQAFWHDELLEGGLFAFFFPYQEELYEVKLRLREARHVPSQWDWRSLVGRLARWSSFEEGGTLEDAPPEFRARRKYWRLLELLENEPDFE